jgi:hypothetical protein
MPRLNIIPAISLSDTDRDTTADRRLASRSARLLDPFNGNTTADVKTVTALGSQSSQILIGHKLQTVQIGQQIGWNTSARE